MKNLTLLFDMDGTVIDSTEAIMESFDAAFRAFGMGSDRLCNVSALIGYPLDEMFVKLGVERARAQEFVGAYKAHYRTVARQKTNLINGSKEAVEEAYKFARLGVVTTKTSLYTKEILDHFDILKYFDTVVGREDVAHPKPHPEGILKALALMDVKKEGAWMIGDTILDLGAGKAAGVDSIGVLCGYGKKEDLARYTHLIVKDTLEAVRYIKSLAY
ncbi:MAG: HAD family hydrolase [Campylobacteraceae bacterium]|nr:HAD family hydrolase [Campylobacteraceae bacterium]